VVIVIDTLGARQVGFLAPGRKTPNLDRLAAESVVFRRAYSTAPWTQPAVASLLCSRMPSAHGLTRLFDGLGEDQVTLAELLQERGLRTAGVVSHDLLGARFGFGQGFQTFDESPIAGHQGISSEKVTDAALAQLRQLAGKSFFLFVHYFDPHYVYNHHEAFDQTSFYKGPLRPAMGIWDLLNLRPKLTDADVRFIAGLHAEEVAYTDHEVGRLLSGLRQSVAAGRTLLIVAADHGEAFMDHGWIGHTRTLYEELIHVPLLVSLPGVFPAHSVAEPVSLLDVVPTLLDMSRARPKTRTTQGASLLGVLLGRSAAPAGRPVLAEVSFGLQPDDPAYMVEKMAFKTSAIRGQLKVIHDLTSGRWEYYDLEADPLEAHGPIPLRQGAFLELAERLLAWERNRAGRGSAAPRVNPTDGERESLRSLGYLQ